MEPTRLGRLTELAAKLIPGIDLNACFFDLTLWQSDRGRLYRSGVRFEAVFFNSLCIYNYLHTKVVGNTFPFKFTDIYKLSDASPSFAAASKLDIDLHNGYRKTTGREQHDHWLCHNILTHNATFDGRNDAIYFQVKFSLRAMADGAEVAKQFKQLNDSEDVLIWVQLGVDELTMPAFRNELAKTAFQSKKLIIINGQGCCSPMHIRILNEMKKYMRDPNSGE
jgi:hypothetical protein